MDVKAKAEQIIAKIKSDPSLAAKFKSDPVPTVEGLIGVDLPDDATKKIVDFVRANLTADRLSGIVGKMGGLFGKQS